jgi:tetratricopeptide (TPR) repeat protein
MQREFYAEATVLLDRFEQGGMLSGEADTMRRAAAFLALFARPLWRMTGADIPRYFKDGCYYLAGEMGVLRYPTADLPEVARCCQQGEFHHANKRRLIEDALELWQAAGDELAAPISLLLKRLLEHKGQRCSTRLSYWRDAWSNTREKFEHATRVLMRGVAATAAGDLTSAERFFNHAAQLDPHSSAPLVNLVYLCHLNGRDAQAEALTADVLNKFPRDGPTLVALGRLALQKNDTVKADRFLCMALDFLEPPTEALIWLGEVKLAEGLYLESQHYYDYAKQLDEALPEPKFGLARIYMETQRYNLAIENLDSIIDKGPDAARDLAWYMLYRAYRQKNEDVRAFDCLDKIAPQFFKEPDLLDDIAVHLEGEKRYTQAREFAERAMILRAGRNPRIDDSDTFSGAL